MNAYIWCALGALLGAASAFGKRQGRVALLENIGVGVFGAFVGGDFLVAMFGGLDKADTAFHIGSLGLAAAGAIVMLLALRLMRGAVGPLRPARKAGQRRS